MPQPVAARLFRVIVPVPEIEAGAEFYARLFGAPGERVAETRHSLDCGGVILALVQPVPGHSASPDFRPLPDYVYLAVDDLEVWRDRVRAIDPGLITGEIERHPWGERSFYLRDPFGTPLCFVDGATLFRGHA
ncbi:MAG: VOC family protein [Chloroflexi bacterium]|nr:VOC family protein [Chloroflexota bacterium]MDA1002281.1 VOC family protein [Chloroflexota bacterium]